MRNVFDQYGTPENRLTHALASCLAEDEKLLRRFIRWATGKAPPRFAEVEIVEQQLPGDPEIEEREADRRGLPDICIHDGNNWCLAVESKVMARLSAAQLRRHEGTIRRRGFSDVNLLAITTGGKIPRIADGVYHKSWTDVYKWSRRHQAVSPWAGRLAEYLEVAEMRMAASGYLTEGALTEFSGVPFGPKHSYNYPDVNRHRELAHHRRPKLTHPGLVKSVRRGLWIPRLDPPASVSTGSILHADCASNWVMSARRLTTPSSHHGLRGDSHRRKCCDICRTRPLCVAPLAAELCRAKSRGKRGEVIPDTEPSLVLCAQCRRMTGTWEARKEQGDGW